MGESLIESFRQFKEENKSDKGGHGQCKTCHLEQNTLSVVNDLLKEERELVTIHKWLKSLGHNDISYDSLWRHRANHI